MQNKTHITNFFVVIKDVYKHLYFIFHFKTLYFLYLPERVYYHSASVYSCCYKLLGGRGVGYREKLYDINDLIFIESDALFDVTEILREVDRNSSISSCK